MLKCKNCDVPIPHNRGSGLCQRCYRRNWEKTHPEKVKARQKKYYQQHGAEKKAYYQEHIDELRAQHRRWHSANRERRSLYKRQLHESIRQKALERICQGTVRCTKCGFADVRALEIDHIHGNGREDRKRFSCSTAYYKYLLGIPVTELEENYQSLCANCNIIKRYENNEVPFGVSIEQDRILRK